MKKKYLFPILYLLLEAVSLVITPLFDIAFVLSMPAMLIFNRNSGNSSGPLDTTYLVMGTTVIQFFVLGLIWDFVSAKRVESVQSRNNSGKS